MNTDTQRNILRRLMQNAGWSAYSLAEVSGVPQPTIHRFLTGTHEELRISTLRRLARALGVTEAQFRGFEPLDAPDGDSQRGFATRFNQLVAEVGGPQTIQRLGAWLGVSATMAWKYRNGENVPAMGSAIDMARKFNCCVEYLLTGKGPKRPGEALPAFTEAFARLSDRDQTVTMALVNAFLHTPE